MSEEQKQRLSGLLEIELMRDNSDLLNRLDGIYTVPVNDGAGLLNGKDTFTRKFDNLPPIWKEAADEIRGLNRELANAYQLLGLVPEVLEPGQTDLCIRGDKNSTSVCYHMHQEDWDESLARQVCIDVAQGINPKLKKREELFGNSIMLTGWSVDEADRK